MVNRFRSANCITSALLLALVAGAWFGGMNVAKAQDAAPNALSEEALGKTIEALGLKPQKVETRYDFRFKTKFEGEEWDLTMSAVLSNNGETLWVMAWLDELPTSSEDVPKVALLRLLARNDEIGNGKFFAYIPANRRFVLQKVLPNQNITPRVLGTTLKDLGASVRAEYPMWAVSSWKNGDAPATAGAPSSAQPTQSAINDPKYNNTTRR